MSPVALVFLHLLSLGLAVPLPVPTAVSSIAGSLDITLTLERVTMTTSTGVTVRTRAFNGSVPGPTLRMKPGDELKVRFQNLLPDQGSVYVHNAFSAADESNIHFHGLHVSGELPSDDSTVVVFPGEERVYTSALPSNHMPGTHWLHPHRHGSTALQVGGGAALALIVEDPPGSLPAQVAGAPEVIFMVMQMDLGTLSRIASRAEDGWFSSSGGTLPPLVNGEVNPTVSVNAGEWMRFRIIYAGWLADVMNFQIAGCEMALLAKDGIYIRDFPRMVSDYAPIAVGGRADIMVRCMNPSSTYQVVWAASAQNGRGDDRDESQNPSGTIATISTGSSVASSDLASWTPTYPSYLTDLQSAGVSAGCSCDTQLEGPYYVNGRRFEYGDILHETYLGAVVERSIRARSHPYHQHVYPFQLISGENGNGDYDQPGDWHDTVEGAWTVRYKPEAFAGKVMFHCHRLDHEDEGMMSLELVKDSGDCVCRNGSTWLVWVIVVVSVLVFIVLAVVGLLIFNKMKYGVWGLCASRRSVSPSSPKDGTSKIGNPGLETA
mmetsp:Transcript_3221/g.7585  ORF Transcript_3221/g.7585 Transcript_3221/m.7585 type:complete len:548 (+) Transcript_3221:85-1728(+)